MLTLQDMVYIYWEILFLKADSKVDRFCQSSCVCLLACLLVLVTTGPLKICADKDPFKIGLMKEQRMFTPYKLFSPKKKEHIQHFFFPQLTNQVALQGRGTRGSRKARNVL